MAAPADCGAAAPALVAAVLAERIHAPLAALLAAVRWLQMQVDPPACPPPVVDGLAEIAALAYAALHGVRDLRVYCDPAALAPPIETPFRLHKILDGAKDLALSEHHQTQFSVKVEVSEDMEVMGDLSRLQHLLSTLLNLAHARHGVGPIHMAAALEDLRDAGTHTAARIRFTVTRGAGDDDVLSVLGREGTPTFEPLALAVAHRLCRELDSELEATPNGHCLALWLPALPAACPAGLTTKSILVLDPAPAAESYLVQLCRLLGLQVTAAAAALPAPPAGPPYDAMLCTAAAVTGAACPTALPPFPPAIPWALVGPPDDVELAAAHLALWPAPTVLLSPRPPSAVLFAALQALCAAPAPGPPGPPPDCSTLRTAVVGDPSIDRIALTSFLRRAGCSPTLHSDAAEVLAQHDFADVVFLAAAQCGPRLGETTWQLLTGLPEAMVVVLTGGPVSNLRPEGRVVAVPTPLSLSSMWQVMETVVKRRCPAASSPARPPSHTPPALHKPRQPRALPSGPSAHLLGPLPQIGAGHHESPPGLSGAESPKSIKSFSTTKLQSPCHTRNAELLADSSGSDSESPPPSPQEGLGGGPASIALQGGLVRTSSLRGVNLVVSVSTAGHSPAPSPRPSGASPRVCREPVPPLPSARPHSLSPRRPLGRSSPRAVLDHLTTMDLDGT